MSVEIRVPPLGESVVEATVGRWSKQAGEAVRKDELLVELETDKITVEVSAQRSGTLTSIEKEEGETVGVDDLLATLEEGEVPETAEEEPAVEEAGEVADPAQAEEPVAAGEAAAAATQEEEGEPAAAPGGPTSPSARKLAAERGVDLSRVSGSGPRGRITREDVERFAERGDGKGEPARKPAPAGPPVRAEGERETRERMSRRRETIARRLLEAQQTTASLTTFNEVDLGRVMEIRAEHKEAFHERHGVKLGFMSFFTRAVVGALQRFPRVNGEIQGNEIVLKHHYDIGIAVGTEQGLVVPVLRDADRLSFAGIEEGILDLAGKARDSKLTLEDLQGGTFTITNGGIYGSMLSTPILNPPQVGILGMHNIVQRPVAVEGEIRVRPMMYIALTYDHRMVDGQEAVRFLVAVKEMLEAPESMLLEG